MNKQRTQRRISSLLLMAGIALQTAAQSLTENIRLNQIGFYPDAPKEAVWVGAKQDRFFVLSESKRDTVFRGTLSAQRTNVISGKTTQIADFSSFRTPGNYVVFIPAAGHSYSFEISPNVHRPAAIGALRGYYYQRVSTELPEKYAGVYKRPAGHPDDQVRIHASAATQTHPEGTLIAAPRGWYDAGDYNKYIVNSGISMGTLFLLYENHPGFLKTLEANIPESGDAVPDLLDEALWNLRWMLAMQDPADGGVYHKLTNAAFDKMTVMPHQATAPRYVIQKTITATLDFAAVMAQASRIYRKFDKQFPKLADSCLIAAEKAWNWAGKNPNRLYDQNRMNQLHDPDVTTGAYNDENATDEWAWASAELYITTRNEAYYNAGRLYPTSSPELQTWRNVHRMSYYSLLQHQATLTAAGKKDLPKLRAVLLSFADSLLHGKDTQAYNTVMGKTVSDFMWGSSGHAANQSIALLQAYRLTKDKKYLRGALSNVDYLFGRNAVGYSFLTGFGSKQVMHLHHRPSESDGIDKPVPGLLSGGTNPGKQDKCPGYTTDIADESFLDNNCSYSTNENCINWNAPLVYILVAMEALSKDF